MDFAPQVKAAVDIVNVVGDYVRLKKQGSRYVGLCPFHTEKTPSFSVHPTLQFYKCFGCGKGGDVFNFLMELEGLSFFEALKMLAEQHGIPMPKRGPDAMADEQTRLRAAIHQMHELAQRLFRTALESPEGKAARDYLERRGLALDAAAEFGLGYAPGGNRVLRALEREGFSAEQLEAGKLVLKSREGPGFFDCFRNRLMFPITSETGQIIAFGGRALEADQEPKYLNSHESPIYRKSEVLYNLHRAREAMRRQDRAVLVEGYMDVIGVWRAGIKNVVASCGTALTAEQIRRIGRHTRSVIVNFDPDTAGRNAAERSILLFLEEGFRVRVLGLPDGLDPDEFCKRRGAAAYEELLSGAPSYYLWLADRARQQFDTRTAEGRVAAFQSLMPAINRVNNKIERVALVNDMADRLGVDAPLVLEHFRRAASDRRQPAPAAAPVLRASPAEKVLLRLLVENAEARRELLAQAEQTEAIEGLASASVFGALFALQASGGSFDLAALQARVSETDRKLLDEIIFGDCGDSPTIEQGRVALEALEAAGWQARHRSLHRQIQEAEKKGDLQEALRLVQLKREMEANRRADLRCLTEIK